MVEVEEFREVFRANDSDGSGEIDNIELGGVLRWLGNPADVETTQDLMEEVDVDNSGFVDFEEFLRVMRLPLGPESSHRRRTHLYGVSPTSPHFLSACRPPCALVI